MENVLLQRKNLFLRGLSAWISSAPFSQKMQQFFEKFLKYSYENSRFRHAPGNEVNGGFLLLTVATVADFKQQLL